MNATALRRARLGVWQGKGVRMRAEVYRAEWLHDGDALYRGAALLVRAGRVADVLQAGQPLPPDARLHDLGAGGIAPGMVDVQVNGGGGVMLSGADGVIARICDTHARLGATAILPTLITDTPDATAAVIYAAIGARRAGVAGLAGLHLEGPHLDPRRHGAHDPALIRPMTAADLKLYRKAVSDLGALMITLAPEAASPAQIAELVAAGVIVSLGHSDCTETEARAAIEAGARCVTHLFNAMSPLGHRAPGLAGAALDAPVAAGVIADGLHVRDPVLRIALRAKPSHMLFLVSDAMAVAGTDLDAFTLGGRRILRRAGRLTLADGTLAGADITLPQAVAHLVVAGCGLERALAMATAVPADVIGARAGRLMSGRPADFVHLDDALALAGVWRGGRRLTDPEPLP
ncbi:MAG: N-acetylglucosamine-6-phosphate deacetylase NagA [Rhodobacteraceae bacterium HLUCCA12]|nr:MAG: N-acetylglucosamine-6-phosphate deacetylase NagA [Rhodobacteraceae bacterium HLUCCA12]